MLASKITKTLTRVSDYLVALGPFGLFAVALLDSAFVPLPGGPDALMIAFTMAHPRLMVLYAALATAGSTIGCVDLYYISQRAGQRALKKFSAANKRKLRTGSIVTTSCRCSSLR